MIICKTVELIYIKWYNLKKINCGDVKMQRENKMGVMPVKKLVITMALPIMISMLVQALYNVVDSIFVSKVCEDALTAVSLAFPAQNLMIGVATGTGDRKSVV